MTTAPREIPKTGDNSPASSLLSYVWRMSGWHQVSVCLIAVLVSALNLIPLELQRRIVNEVVETREVAMLVTFGTAYVVVILMHQMTKYAMWLYQSWLTESASQYTRLHLIGLYECGADQLEDDTSGRTVSIVGSEVEKLGGFVGEGISGAVANLAMLLGVCGYMFVVEPKVALFALGFLVPQIILTPIIQRRLNDLVEARVKLLRGLGDEIADPELLDAGGHTDTVQEIYTNRMRFFVLKFTMKAALNLLNSLGPITVLIFGGYMVMQGEVQVGVIVAFLSGFERISSPLRELIGFYRVAAQANVQHRMIAKWIEKQINT